MKTVSHIVEGASNFKLEYFFIMNSSSNILKLCNDNYNHFKAHHMISANNIIDLNTITSSSDDSGVPLTNSSISSGDSYRTGLCKFEHEHTMSDGEVSQFGSLEHCSDVGMSAENFNTLKKGPLAPIDPPPEFQDSPQTTLFHSLTLQNRPVKFSDDILNKVMNRCSSQNSLLLEETLDGLSNYLKSKNTNKKYFVNGTCYKSFYVSDSALNNHNNNNTYDVLNIDCLSSKEAVTKNKGNRSTSKDYFENKKKLAQTVSSKVRNSKENTQLSKPIILCNSFQHNKSNNLSSGNRPNSRNSLSSRLSSSHNSLSVPTGNKADDSIFITQAMSHDALLSREILDFYNVPIDSDIYTFPVDMIIPDNKEIYQRDCERQKCRARCSKSNRRKKRLHVAEATGIEKYSGKLKTTQTNIKKRHSVPENSIEPLHMTLDEVKRFYHNLYSTSNGIHENWSNNISNQIISTASNSHVKISSNNNFIQHENMVKGSVHKNTSTSRLKISSDQDVQSSSRVHKGANQGERKFSINLNLKQKLCNIFRFRKTHNSGSRNNFGDCSEYISHRTGPVNGFAMKDDKKKKFSTRALPPLPSKGNWQKTIENTNKKEQPKSEFISTAHLASSIEKVKDYGWYWGPISSEAAEKVLSNEPDGSFIVRDSSDDHYIFSLSFKLNNSVRHVRIEQDQGTFSFGSYAKFKSQTITEFIEKAVEHSRSGRYLFFLHRRPEHGPMRVQLTNPVSRFKYVQSLQHMCRFVILKTVVRRDLIQTLPLPRRLLDYLSYKHCYSEQIESDSSQSQTSTDERGLNY